MSSPVALLPDVLVQLTMQFLQRSELLQFARSCRRLLSQADSAFAFKHVLPLTRFWSVACPAFALSNVLRHIPVMLIPDVYSSNLGALLDQLSQEQQRLYGLDASDTNLLISECVQLVSHSSMLSIRQLIFRKRGAWVEPEVLAAVARLPHLTSLTVVDEEDAVQSSSLSPSIECLRLLAVAPALTSIALHDTDFRPGSIMAGLVDFLSLRHLAVRQPWIYDDEWVGLFASPGLCGLTSLSFDWCNFTGPSGCKPLNPEHATAVFTSLTQLTRLEFKMPFGIDLILPSLRCASALTALRIQSNCLCEDTLAARVLPSFGPLYALMIAQQNLRIELDLRDHESELRDTYVAKLSVDFAAVPVDVRSRLTVLYRGASQWC